MGGSAAELAVSNRMQAPGAAAAAARGRAAHREPRERLPTWPCGARLVQARAKLNGEKQGREARHDREASPALACGLRLSARRRRATHAAAHAPPRAGQAITAYVDRRPPPHPAACRARHLPPTAYRPPPTACRTPHATRRPPHAARRTPHVVRRTPLAARLTPHAARRTPHATSWISAARGGCSATGVALPSRGWAASLRLPPGDSSPRRRLLRSLRQVKSRQSCTTASHRSCTAAGKLPAELTVRKRCHTSRPGAKPLGASSSSHLAP